MIELNPGPDGPVQSYSELSERSQKVLRVLGADKILRSSEIAQALGLRQTDLSPTLTRLVRTGWVERISRGRYRRNAELSMFGADGKCACRSCCDHGSSGSS